MPSGSATATQASSKRTPQNKRLVCVSSSPLHEAPGCTFPLPPCILGPVAHTHTHTHTHTYTRTHARTHARTLAVFPLACFCFKPYHKNGWWVRACLCNDHAQHQPPQPSCEESTHAGAVCLNEPRCGWGQRYSTPCSRRDLRAHLAGLKLQRSHRKMRERVE